MMRLVLLSFFAFLLAGHAEAQKIKHVVLIGIDGLGANYISQDDMPTLASLMKNGTYTLHARCVLPSSSAANWASMFMGASPELHGYTQWNSKTPEIPSRTLDQYGLFPSIYSLLHEQRPKADIALFYAWDGIGYLFPKRAVTTYALEKSDDDTTQQAVGYIENHKPTLLLAYMSGMDDAGHKYGWGSPAYYEREHEIDRHIAQIVEAIRNAGISDSTAIIVSADHGGIDKGHGGKTVKEMEIPWIIDGPGIKRNYEIKDSIMTYDTAATIASIFRLKAPQVWIGRPVKAAFNH